MPRRVQNGVAAMQDAREFTVEPGQEQRIVGLSTRCTSCQRCKTCSCQRCQRCGPGYTA